MIAPEKSPLGLRVVRICCRILFGVVMLGLALWSIMAIYYSNIPIAWLRQLTAIIFTVAAAGLFVWVRPTWVARLLFLAACALVIAWFVLTPPSNSRNWQSDVAILPFAEIRDDDVIIHNIRNCDYRSETDYVVRHYDKSFKLSDLQSVDLYVVYWGSKMIAHTMLSFGFEGGDYLCFSIETRKEAGESYSAIKGFFRQFELTYVVGDERDLVRLRTNFRQEQVYLYRLKTDLSTARAVLIDYLREVNRLKDMPQWYNALVSNCTTNIRGHTKPYVKGARFDWRLLLNGHIDELAFERGALTGSMPFRELKTRSLINERARVADIESFSRDIREGLPGRSGDSPVRLTVDNLNPNS